MDTLNLKLHLEQVNHSSDSLYSTNWEENVELAMNSVVDPNTEFKSNVSEKNNISVSPVESYGLTDFLQKSVQLKVAGNTQQGFDSNPLVFQIEAAITGDLQSKQNLNLNDNSTLPQVHAYVSPQLTPREPLFTMENYDQSMGVNMTTVSPTHYSETQGRLFKYPPERITVLTEKRSFMSPTHSKSNIVEHAQLHNTSVAKSPSITEQELLSGRNSKLSTRNLSGLDRSQTTADQLAWAFRTARDRLDTASNISGCSSRFELDSNCSERAETMSTISDVSGYEEEMFRIRRLLLLDTPSSPVGRHNYKHTEHSKELHVKPKSFSENPSNTVLLSSQGYSEELHSCRQLQNAVAEKENYRLQLAEVETKISLKWQEKCQEILRQKAHIEGRLETVQAELETLLSERQTVLDQAKILENAARTRSTIEEKVLLQEMEKLALEYSNIQQLSRELEQQKQELMLQLELKDSEITRWKEETQDVEASNEKLRIEIQELRVEMDSKDGAVQGLKRKVAEQHVEFQTLLQAKLKAENSLTSSKNEMESIRKSGHWYRDQLHICQAAKVKVQQELMASQSNLVSHNHLVEKLKNENAHLHLVVKDTQQRAVREKESLMRKLEVIQADMMEREAAILGQIHRDDVTAETITSIKVKLSMMEEEKGKQSGVLVKELEEQIEALNKNLQSRDTFIEKLEKEYSQVMTRVTMMQKTLNEKELLLQSIDNKYKHLEMCYHETTDNLKSKEQTLLEVKNEKVNTEVALAAAMKEKLEVDSAINKLREDFTRITKSYQSMKTKIRSKDKLIDSLEMEINEQKKVKEAQSAQIKKLEEVESEFKTFQYKVSQIQNLEQELVHVINENKELHSKVSHLNELQNHMQSNALKLDETLAFREEQLMNQARNFEVHTEELKAKDEVVLRLQNEKIVIEENSEKLHQKVMELESVNRNVLNELQSYKKRLSDSNGVIEQFNLLCRGSEQEKYHLDKQLKRVMRELNAVHIKSEIKTNLECNPIIHKSPDLKSNPEQDVIANCETIPAHDVILTKANLHMLQKFVEENETKIMGLVSEIQKKSIHQLVEKSQVEQDFVKFETISERLAKMSCSLDKALEVKESLSVKMHKEIELREIVESKFMKLENEFRKKAHSEETLFSNTKKQSNGIAVISETSLQSVTDTPQCHCKEEIQVYQRDIEKLKSSLKLVDIEQREKSRRYESNTRTLLKKVKEHMRGRKVAEQQLSEISRKSLVGVDEVSEIETLQLKVKKLETDVETSRRQYEEQRRIAERNQETVLQLERERGKLAQSQDVQRALSQPAEEREESVSATLDQAREMQLQQAQRKVADLENEARQHAAVLRELKKQVFAEKCENSKLRKQLTSLRLGLDTANEMLDAKNAELSRNESWCQTLTLKNSDLQKTLELEERAHEENREGLERLRTKLEEAHAKDPLLADQIKTLSYHLHQKNQEAAGLKEQLLLSEERWNTVESGLHQNVTTLQGEGARLRAELETLRRDKFTLQTQGTELRTALHSSLDQNKMLKLKLEAYGCDGSKDKLPDLTSSLPSPPLEYDETQIAELLHQSAVLPSNKPLSNLQSCLDSLKQEMDVLQMQLTVKTSGYSLPVRQDVAKLEAEHSKVQDV